MKSLTLTVAASLLCASSAFAYQVTGTVISVTDSKIVVDKKGEKFEMARTATTPVKGGEIKPGMKVTVQYDIAATDIEVKGAGEAAGAKKKKGK